MLGEFINVTRFWLQATIQKKAMYLDLTCGHSSLGSESYAETKLVIPVLETLRFEKALMFGSLS